MRMWRYALSIALFLLFSSSANAASNSQIAYWLSLISGMTDVVLLAMKVFAVGGLFVTLIYFLIALFGDKKDAMARREMKPKSYTRFGLSFIVLYLLYMPTDGVRLFGDLIGLGANGLPVCFVADVNPGNSAWQMSASQCMDHVSSQVKSLSGFTEIPAIGTDMLRVFMGFVQLLSLVFMLFALWGILKHMIGFRNQGTGLGGYVGGYLASNAIFLSNNAIPFILDIAGRTPVPVISSGG